MSFDFQKGKISHFLIDLLSDSLNLDVALNNLIYKSEEFQRLKNEPGDFLNPIIDEIVLNLNGLRSVLIDESTSRDNKNILKDKNQNDKKFKINNKEELLLLQSNIDRLNLENENLLKLKNQQQEILNNLKKDKEEDDERIDLLSNDLEQQIDECMEANQKISDHLICDSESKKSIISLIKKISPMAEVNETDSVTNLLTILESLMNSKPDENSVHNTSIIDLDNIQMESICWNETHIVEKHIQCHDQFNLVNESCYNLENFDSELLVEDFNIILEEIDSLDFDNKDKIDSLIKQSNATFMKCILIKLECKEESKIGIQLRKMFKSYENILCKKIKGIQYASVDLNNTCVFEKLEKELDEICEVKKQLDILRDEKSSLQDKLEEIIRHNECKDVNILTLSKENTNLSKTLEDIKFKANELKEINNCLELNFNELKKDIQCKEEIIKEIKDENNSCKTALSLARDNNVEIKNVLIKSEETVSSICKQFAELQLKVAELEEKICELTLENKQLKGDRGSQEIKCELEMLKINLSEVLKEKEYYENEIISYKDKLDGHIDLIKVKESVLIEKETVIKSLEEDIKSLQAASDDKLLELETAIDDSIKLSEELEQMKCYMVEKENERDILQSDLNKNKLDLENIKKENEIITNNLQEKIIVLENQSLTLKNSLEEYKEKVDNLETDNTSLQQRVLSLQGLEIESKNISEYLKDLEVKYFDTLTKYNSLEEEKIEHMKHVEELEETCCSLRQSIENINKDLEKVNEESKNSLYELTEEIKSIRYKSRNDLNNAEMNMLDMSNKLNVNQTEISELLFEKEQLIGTFKSYEEQMSEEILKASHDIDVKSCLVVRMENMLKAKDSNLNELKKQIESKNIEVQAYTNELKLLRKSTIDKENVAVHDLKIKLYEAKINESEVEMKTWKNKFYLKEDENEDLRKKIKESHTDENVIVKLQEEIKILKVELNNAGNKKEYEMVVNAYNDLKDRYREKRKRTDDLNTKYEKLAKFCRERGLVLPNQ